MMQYPPSSSGPSWSEQQQPSTGYPQWPQSPSQPLSPQEPFSGYTQPGHYQQTQHSTLPPTMPPPPSKRAPRGPWFYVAVGLIIGLFLGFVIGIPIGVSAGTTQSTTPTPVSTASTQDNADATAAALQLTTAAETPIATAQPVTPTPPPQPKWTTIHSYSGNGTQKTGIFSVPTDWRISWKCTGFTDGSGIDGNMNITIYDDQNNLIDNLYENCKVTGSSGVSEEHQGGNVYLSIDQAGSGWSVQVQVLK